jgi:hypothetical protein
MKKLKQSDSKARDPVALFMSKYGQTKIPKT